jgi:hypothetical protein
MSALAVTAARGGVMGFGWKSALLALALSCIGVTADTLLAQGRERECENFIALTLAPSRTL